MHTAFFFTHRRRNSQQLIFIFLFFFRFYGSVVSRIDTGVFMKGGRWRPIPRLRCHCDFFIGFDWVVRFWY